jgi:hypothetical protein
VIGDAAPVDAEVLPGLPSPVPTKVRVAVTGAGVRLRLLGRLPSCPHMDRRVWRDAGT